MKKKELEFFRNTLNRRLEELMQESAVTVAEFLSSVVDSADPIDRAEVEVERNFAIRMLERENRLIMKIKRAMQKIEDHTFGICEGC